ncbi:MAG TPA: hypothetical protein IAA77_05285 [Candidatus Avibacteroides excrementipullorum]|nr:hypothetical protein [Candidatus Avibacteroides excrementipullorum]
MEPENKKSRKNLYVIAGVALVALLAVMTVLFFLERKDNKEKSLLFQLEKEEMENDYMRYARQYDELQINLNNDSLSLLLDKEKTRVQRLLEELRLTKASNTAEILRLRKELETVRAVSRNYVLQIDSLTRLNKALGEENQELKASNTAARRKITDLSKEREKLHETVTLASMLNASNISVAANNKRGKKARRVKDIVKFVIDFTIDRNPTSEAGEKMVYVRITAPDNSLLVKPGSGTFEYENKRLEYSICRNIEYTGEEQAVTLYWDVEEFLFEGVYRVDIFVDGNLIGTHPFEL